MLRRGLYFGKAIFGVSGKSAPQMLKFAPSVSFQPKNYFGVDKNSILLRDEKNGYFLDPEEVSRKFIKLLAMHDKVKDPSKVTLGSTFHDIGLDDLAFVEVMVEAEQEFFLEIPDDDLERMKTVRDAVEYISRSFFAA